MKRFLVLGVLIILSGCYEDKMREQYKLAGCTFFQQEDLKERKNCGKACTRHVKKETWYCPNQQVFVSFTY